nr:hypothetical protein OG781_03725 [Streptomyces sp. NBC_00830]
MSAQLQVLRQLPGAWHWWLRQWARLRVAVAELPRESAAAAAAFAGFADQANFTRTARRLLGRTPSSITRPAA